ncbi:MAG: aminotransferase class I/II-fold pyridoxal phosphate-dependent enzyme [Armatimonadetes bacterium]|nr:aminotransferase class I/II-fold pyridoxal phosphate-dependent enzyme [Armatimonadota bacterium]
MSGLIDLSSDTVTQPSDAMRKAMAKAPVGDLQKGEDPTVRKLEEMTAELLGTEAAVFLPSGTMCNQIAFRIHGSPGDEVIMHAESHPAHLESGAIASLCQMMIYPVSGDRGLFGPEDVRAAMRPNDVLYPRTRIVFIENTHNLCGGTIWPIDLIRSVCDTAAELGLARHLDGSRLFNASVATGISLREYCAHFDSCNVALSKGLGAPVGSMLAGSKAFIDEALRWRRAFGGAMRQAGIIAAAGIYALEHNIDRLAEDHANAKVLAEGLALIDSIDIDPTSVETNIVLFDIARTGMDVPRFMSELISRGVRMSSYRGTKIRAVTHLDVALADVKKAVDVVKEILA